MVENQLGKPAKLINVIDKGSRDAIIRLDQKLKGLRAEILVKLENIADETDDIAAVYKENLDLLLEDIDKAVEDIESLVNTIITAEATESDIAQINQEVENLRETITGKTEMISKLTEQF